MWVLLSEVVRWPRNPKLHDLDNIQRSMEKFGFILPLSRDGASGKLVAGHGRLAVLERMHIQRLKRPKHIREDAEGNWLVPVLKGISFANEKEAEEYLLLDNRLVENGGWDNEELLKLIQEQLDDGIVIEELGWSQEELDDIIIRSLEDPFGEEGPEVEKTNKGKTGPTKVKSRKIMIGEIEIKVPMAEFEKWEADLLAECEHDDLEPDDVLRVRLGFDEQS